MPEGFTQSDHTFMRRAMALAARGRGAVEPNPMVGCVIVREGRVIGEGFHREFGQPHAEAEALGACTESPEGATAYVTLEPCCHTNKKTRPCVPRLIGAKIRRIAVACLDPNPKVSGSGAGQLRASGIEVSVGLLEAEAKQLNAPFFALVRYHRPYVTLKWAQTADGKVAAPPGAPRLLITGSESNRLVHRLRARCDAIMVGINTVLADDPLLTVRDVEPKRRLMRVVLDRDLRIPLGSELLQTSLQAPTLVFCHEPDAGRAAELKMLGVEVIDVPVDGGSLRLQDVLGNLAGRNLTHLLVEPGPRLGRSFFSSNLADRAWIFHSPRQATDPNSLDAPEHELKPVAQADVGSDRLVELLNPHSPVYFSSEPSVDFIDHLSML